MSSTASALPTRRPPTSPGDSAPAPHLARNRRAVQLALAVLWLVDAGLQCQRYMFTQNFVTQTLEPAAAGAPPLVQQSALWADRFMLPHIGFYNTLFAMTQLLIAFLIFYRPTVRLGLALSALWALGIWWSGEGLGGITQGVPAAMGAPGAAVLYAVISVLAWPRAATIGAAGTGATSPPRHSSVAEASPLGRRLPQLMWVVLWVGLAALGLESANRTSSALHDTVAAMAYGEPGWIGRLDRVLAAPLAHHGLAWSVGLAVVFTIIALGVLAPTTARPALILAMLLGCAIWLAQDFGGIFTGSATDPNSGPLLILLAATFWPRPTNQATTQ